MGVCYEAVNHTKRERIDPAHIGGGASKFAAMAYGAPARILAFLMVTSWAHDRVEIVADEADTDEDVERIGAYEDVTERAVQAWNERRPKDEPSIEYRKS